jgi:hypothetical protein
MLKVQNQVEQLEKYYTLGDKAQVLAFIEQNPKLLELLLAAPNQIRRFFPTEPLSLDLVHYYDAPGEVELWIHIETDEDDTAGIDKLDQLFDAWWIDNADEFSKVVGLGLD